MSKTRTYLVSPNPFGVEPGVYEAVYDESLRCTFRSAPRLCKRVTSTNAEASKARRLTLQKAAALGYRCWYCGQAMNPLTIGAPDSIEIEHQLPRSSGRSEVERLENMVAACRRCNNGAYPGKGEEDVEGFRMILADYHEAGRVVFFGEVLRWVRDHAAQLHLNLPLTAHDSQRVLGWYRAGSCVKLHSWNDADYLQGLCAALPADDFLFPLGVPADYWKPTQWTSIKTGELPRARSASIVPLASSLSSAAHSPTRQT